MMIWFFGLSTLLMLLIRLYMCVVWWHMGGIVGMIVAASEGVAFLLGLVNAVIAPRRDFMPSDLLLPAAYLSGSLLGPVPTADVAWIAFAVAAVALLQTTLRIHLGFCFSVGPSTFVRVVEDGVYSFIRHPLNALCILLRLLMLIAWPSLWNLGVFLVFAAAMCLACLVEERFLLQFSDWRAYASRVRWRLVPGVW